MGDEDKTREQLLSELAGLRQRVAELEKLETERKRMEEALRESEQKYRTFVESSHEVVFGKDRNGCYHTLNLNAAIGLGGTCIEDVEGKTDYDLLPKEQADALRKTDKRIMESGKPIEVEEVVRNAQGENRIYLSYKWPTYDDKGRIAGISCFATDITERKRVEEALRESEEKLRRMFESVNDGITVTDLNGVITDVNERTLELGRFGSRSDVIGKSAIESIVPCDQERALRDMQELAQRGVVGTKEYTLVRADGSEYPAEISANVLKDATGNVIGFVSIIRDVTDLPPIVIPLVESLSLLK